MSDFLDLIDQIEAREAYDPQMLTRDDPHFTVPIARLRRTHDPRYMRGLREVAKLLQDVRAGLRSDHVLREAMTTSDFPLLFGDIIDRAMLGHYSEWVVAWRRIVRESTVRDFRSVKRLSVTGGETILAEVKEQAEYPAAALSSASTTFGVKKYGRRMPFSWETMINDDMESLIDVPRRFARAARRSEDRYVTTLYAGASGPLASLYSVGNVNIVTGNPVLSITALQTALTVLAAQTDAGGDPILIEAVELVVPPALEIVARNILNATQLEIGLVGQGAVAAPVTENRIITANWMRDRVTLTVNPYLPLVSTTNGNTSWYLFASPNGGRPAIEFAFLRGNREPQLFMKSPNAVRVGGGSVDPMQGDFDTDTIDYKVRHVFGGAVIDPKMTVASNGTGS